MSKRWIKAAATSQTIDIFVLDSSSTTGGGLTGLVFNTAGLTCYYRKGALGTPTAVTLATLASVTTPWATGGFIAVDATYMAGVYRLDIPDVVIDTAGMVTMYLRGATNMAPVVLELEVVAVNIYDTVRLGLTAIPNFAQGTAGALPTGNATGQVTVAGTASGAITNTSFAAGAITATVIADGAIDAATFADSALVIGNLAGTGVKAYLGVGSITAGVIADAAIDAATFADSALVIGSAAAVGVKAYLGAESITAGVVATGAIDADAIAADAITAVKIANDAITNAKIADSAITIRLSTDGTASKARIIAGSIATDVWSALVTAHTVAESFGARIIRTLLGTTVNQVTINASNHIAANVHQMQANVINAAAIAADAIDADALATDAVTEIADGILARDIGSGTNAVVLNERTVRSALRALRNKSSILTSTLTVTTENDATTAWTAAVSSSASADPVTGIDPAGP
jgi:hypothetical protein